MNLWKFKCDPLSVVHTISSFDHSIFRSLLILQTLVCCATSNIVVSSYGRHDLERPIDHYTSDVEQTNTNLLKKKMKPAKW